MPKVNQIISLKNIWQLLTWICNEKTRAVHVPENGLVKFFGVTTNRHIQTRKKKVEQGSQFRRLGQRHSTPLPGRNALDLLYQWQEKYSSGRGQSFYFLFVSIIPTY
jgi:hypothetical protein